MVHRRIKSSPVMAIASLFFFVICIVPVQAASLVSSYSIYYGHLHNHCSISDGTGTADEAYSAAKAAGLDFFSLSDHAYLTTSDEYLDIQAAADTYNEPDVFTAFRGFEWTSSSYGHITVINSSDYTAANNGATDTLAEFMGWLGTRSCVAFFNHPGRYNGSGTEFEHFSGAYSDKIVGIELWNKTDLFSRYYYNSGYTSGTTDRSGYFDEALLLGWEIGASGSEDNHSGTWGQSQYRLAILAGANTRTSLYDALKQRRFYSTLDKSLELSFEVDGQPMGAVVSGGSATVCTIEAADKDGETFSKIELIHNGNVVRTWLSSEFTDDTHPVVTAIRTTGSGDYLYCTVTQTDGGEAISSPVFVDGPPKADLISPEEGGPDDQNPNAGEVTVNTPQPVFQIQLSDISGINDASVTSDTVSITGLTSNVDYYFSYDSGNDIITLSPAGSTFGNGTYAIVLAGISDTGGAQMTSTTLTVLIDTSIVLPETRSFQQGVNGYTGTVDTMLHGAYPTDSYATVTTITLDASDAGSASHVLLRFEGIIGGAQNQIPLGATVSGATLRLRSLDTGQGGQLHAMLQAWSDGSTWSSLVNGIQTDGIEAASSADDGISSNSISDIDLEVTGTIQAWVDGTSNYGWVLLPNSGTTDGWDVASSEYATVDYRPELIVTFTTSGNRPPTVDAGSDQAVEDSDGDGWESVTLTGSASDSDGTVVGYSWMEGVLELGTSSTLTDSFAVGTHIVTLTVTDNEGAMATDSVVVTVSQNREPVAQNDAYTMNVGNTLTINAPGVLSNDSDPDNDPLDVILVSESANGSLTLNADGSFVYTPNSGFAGTDEFTYQVSDGTLLSDPAFVEINVLSEITVENTAQSETLVEGTLASGNYQATWSYTDGAVEVIEEAISGNNKNIKRSTLEHIWVFSVQGSEPTSIHLKATAQIEAGSPDQFTFAYSTDGVLYTDFATLSGAIDNEYPLPSVTSGTLYIRVRDTNGDKLEPTTDAIAVDYLCVKSTTTGLPDMDPPSQPTGLTVVTHDLDVQLSWQANSESDIAGYRVYRSTTQEAGYTEISGLVNGTDYTDSVSSLGIYYYVIKGEDTSGNLSIASQAAMATVIDTPPAMPTGLIASAGDTQVSLDWDDNTESDLMGYRIYRNGGLVSGSTPIVVSDFVDTGLLNGFQYLYAVTAVDLAGQEGEPASISSTPQQSITVSVASVDVTVIDSKKYSAEVTVVITPALAGAVITGDWYFKGALRDMSVSASTNSSGSADISTSFTTSAKSGDEFTFIVTGVILSGYTYDSDGSVETQDSGIVP